MQGDSALGTCSLALFRDLRRAVPGMGATPQTLRPYFVEEALELDHAESRLKTPRRLKDDWATCCSTSAFQIVDRRGAIAIQRERGDAEFS